jgi:hypothetical protein
MCKPRRCATALELATLIVMLSGWIHIAFATLFQALSDANALWRNRITRRHHESPTRRKRRVNPKNRTQARSVWYRFYGSYAAHPNLVSCLNYSFY